jgi:hypothetical protein
MQGGYQQECMLDSCYTMRLFKEKIKYREREIAKKRILKNESPLTNLVKNKP